MELRTPHSLPFNLKLLPRYSIKGIADDGDESITGGSSDTHTQTHTHTHTDKGGSDRKLGVKKGRGNKGGWIGKGAKERET